MTLDRNRGGILHPTVKAARIAGFTYLAMIAVAPFCLLYVPGKLIVHGNAAATAKNILTHETLFRMSIFGDLIGQVIFICLGVAFYRLLRDVNKTWALLMLSFILVSAAVCFLNVLNDLAALILFRGGDFLAVIDNRNVTPWQCFSCVCTVMASSSPKFFGDCGCSRWDYWFTGPDLFRVLSGSG